MKLLLTSWGFRNESIANALLELTGKPFNKTNLVFIPTAADVVSNNSWMIDDMYNCKKLGFASIDVLNLSAVPVDVWKPAMERADVLFFGGGNTFHLMYWFQKLGLDSLLTQWLETKIYVGLSSSTIAATPSVVFAHDPRLYSPEIGEITINNGLSLVKFQVRPHLNSPAFPDITFEYAEKLANKIKDPLYAIDDNSAIQVIDNQIKVISEGEWHLFNK